MIGGWAYLLQPSGGIYWKSSRTATDADRPSLPANCLVDHRLEAIGDPILADAILDRLAHNAHRLLLSGESLRRRANVTKPLDRTDQA